MAAEKSNQFSPSVTVSDDRLNQEQRIRLEALSQAVALNAMKMKAPTLDTLLKDADHIANFIGDGTIAKANARGMN